MSQTREAGFGRRGARATVETARRACRQPAVATGTGVLVVVVVALFVPVPTAVQVRDWATSVGPWFPMTFLGAHIVATVVPFPRTVFTLAAGLLFGPVLGVVLAVVASGLSALIALAAVRAAGWRFGRLLTHPRVSALDARLSRRGWPAILSLRLIPAVPFSILNYAAGASAIRTLPYTLATLVGLLPGTAAVVILGNALTGDIGAPLILVSAGTAAVGVALLSYELRSQRRHPDPAAASGPPAVLAR